MSPFPHSSWCDSKGLHLPSSSKEHLWMGFLHREHVPVILPHPTWVATSPGEESPALEKPPYAQPCRASLVHRSCFSPFSQLAANASGATDQVIPQNCSSSLPLTQLLPGSPSPLKSAQRRLLLAICCQRLEKPNINTAANAYSGFPPLPPKSGLFPLSCCHSSSPTSLLGAGNGSFSRGGWLVAGSVAGARSPLAGTCRSGCSAL